MAESKSNPFMKTDIKRLKEVIQGDPIVHQFFKMYTNGECEYIDFLSNALIAMHDREKLRVEHILRMEAARPGSYTIDDEMLPLEAGGNDD